MFVVSRIFSFIMYADDKILSSILKAFQPSSPTESTDKKINNELYKINEWLADCQPIITQCSKNKILNIS